MNTTTENLRPIGTVFRHVFPASLTSSNPCPRRHTYEIVAHILCNDGCGSKHVREEAKCIEIEELPAPEFIPFDALQSWSHYYVWVQDYAKQFA